MATDLDRYGARLGRGFSRVRALLCSPEERELAVEFAARYLERVILKDERDFPGLVREAQRLTQDRVGWLLRDHDVALDRFRHNESRSRAALHVVEATQDVINTTCDPGQVLVGCVRRAVAGTIACAHVQLGYKDDARLLRSLEELHGDIGDSLLRKLSVRIGSGHVERGPVDALAGNQAALLDLVVAGIRP